MIHVTNVTMSVNETFQWIFSGLNVNVSQCSIDPVRIKVQSTKWLNDIERFLDTTITIHNSSFGSLDLNPGTKAQITDCYISGEFKDRPTLITVNSSDVSIQNCNFENFINKKGSTVVFGHNDSNITIGNSVFIQHNSSKGVFFLQNNSSIQISCSLISDNVVTSLGYSSITLRHGTHAVVNNTVFRNNSALAGGAMFAQNKCQVTLDKCTFSSNKATTGKPLNITKISDMDAPAIDKNNIETFTSTNPVLFNQTLIRRDETEVFAAHKVRASTIFKEQSAQQIAFLPGNGGAVGVAVKCQLLMTNCVFEDNSAQNSAGAISAALDVTLDIRETTFASNKALVYDGGVINVGYQVQLRIINCVFDNNLSQRDGGAINGDFNTTVDVQETIFASNKALRDGGAIYIQEVQLRIKNCLFEENTSERIGGAILGAFNAALDVQETTFLGNKALHEAGAIDVEHRADLQIKNCAFDNNTSGQVGGAIFGGFNSTLDVQGTTFANNTALYEGGAIDAQQQVHLGIKNCVFEDNTSEQLGGAIIIIENTMLDIEQTNFTRNSALRGGAVHLNSACFLHATSCVFEDNHGRGFGGALAGGIDAVLEVDRSLFLNNSALFAAAIFSTSNVTLDVQETAFVGNKASSDSGAILVKYQATLRIMNCTFQDNVSQRGLGGAIVGGYNVTVAAKHTYFTRNRAVQGGAIDVDKQSFLHVTDCKFEDNYANLGGAIFGGFNLVCVINGSYFLNNRASQGGAINVQQNVNALITNSRLERNFIYGGLGGGIMALEFVKIKIRETNFTYNNASGRGGALFIDSQSECHVARCVFYSNTASTSGGAVGVYLKSSLHVEYSNFTNNNSSDGGAIRIQEKSKLQTRMCSYWKNVAEQTGGAIKLDKNSTAVIESCRLLENHGIYGGAIHLSSLQWVSVKHTLLLQNVASGDGGAISISDGANVAINNITCVGNHCPIGGCLFIQSVVLTLEKSDISNNFGLKNGIVADNSRMQVGSLL